MEEPGSRSWREVLSDELNAARPHTGASSGHDMMHHVMFHEAGHAVFAIRRGVPFVEVRVDSPNLIKEQLLLDGGAHAGHVQLIGNSPAQWIPERPEEALDVLVAGALAERFFLNCYLEGSFKGDVELWKRGMGAGAVEQGPLYIDSSVTRVWAEMSRCSHQIGQIFSALQDQLKPPVDGESIFDEPLVLTQDQVVSILTGSSSPSSPLEQVAKDADMT